MAATDLCNCTLHSFADGKVTADKLYLPNLDEWKNYPENAPTERITVAHSPHNRAIPLPKRHIPGVPS